MGTVQESVTKIDATAADATLAPPTVPVRARQSLPPKGSCWYCEKTLDSVKRFCNKACADGFDDEAAFTP
ncbi:hypothetical protein [Massilia sp. PWRC2]|uniref:hypothetical protein n=1 Tax=Massilia sp. PWRC2 TaxID=2804626 RepID=UPI003CF176B8